MRLTGYRREREGNSDQFPWQCVDARWPGIHSSTRPPNTHTHTGPQSSGVEHEHNVVHRMALQFLLWNTIWSVHLITWTSHLNGGFQYLFDLKDEMRVYSFKSCSSDCIQNSKWCSGQEITLQWQAPTLPSKFWSLQWSTHSSPNTTVMEHHALGNINGSVHVAGATATDTTTTTTTTTTNSNKTQTWVRLSLTQRQHQKPWVISWTISHTLAHFHTSSDSVCVCANVHGREPWQRPYHMTEPLSLRGSWPLHICMQNIIRMAFTWYRNQSSFVRTHAHSSWQSHIGHVIITFTS